MSHPKIKMPHTLVNRLSLVLLCGLLFTTLSACNFLLPTEHKTSSITCATFDDCKKIFEQIIPYQTVLADLDAFGLNPNTTSNMEQLHYSDIIKRFNYSINHESSYPQGIRECVQSTNSCRGYDLVFQQTQEERTGNTLLDLLQFKRKTEKTGWIFRALLVVKGDLIVYKLMGGTPKVDETNVSTKPLGPLQEGAGGLLPF